MAAPQIVIHFNALTDVVSAYVEGTRAAEVRAGRDNHVVIEFDSTGTVVGVQVLGASKLVPSRWPEHPDRMAIPPTILSELDRWLAMHWADRGASGGPRHA